MTVANNNSTISQARINEARFDAMIRLAVIALNEREMAVLPSDEETMKIHTFSERHERRMAQLFAKLRRKDVFTKIRKVAYRTAAAILIITPSTRQYRLWQIFYTCDLQ